MHVPTYFLSDILMLQVDSLWTALRTEGTKVPNGTCICVFKRHKWINKQKNKICFVDLFNQLMKLILISLIK